MFRYLTWGSLIKFFFTFQCNLKNYIIEVNTLNSSDRKTIVRSAPAVWAAGAFDLSTADVRVYKSDGVPKFFPCKLRCFFTFNRLRLYVWQIIMLHLRRFLYLIFVLWIEWCFSILKLIQYLNFVLKVTFLL